jgi:hypothetical protein
MYRARQHAYVFVTIEKKGETPKLKRWRGESCKSIQKAARKAYPGAHLGFGACIYITD